MIYFSVMAKGLPPMELRGLLQVLKYLQGELSLLFRQRLTAHIFSKYMKDFTFYAVSNLDGRIANPDQVYLLLILCSAFQSVLKLV